MCKNTSASTTRTHLNPLEPAVDEVPVKNVLVRLGRHPVVVHQVDQIRQLSVDVPYLVHWKNIGFVAGFK